jgi:haloacetate dehalogenase
MRELFEMKKVWESPLANMQMASLPGGHFFVDQFPDDMTRILQEFLSMARGETCPN